MEEEQVIIKLIQIFTTLPPPGSRCLWININYNCIEFRNYLSKEDSNILTELRLDTTPENILVRFVYLGKPDNNTSWMNIEIKDLINVIWQQ